MHGDEAQLSQSSVCRVIKDMSEAFARRREQFMKFPTSREEVEATQQQFYQYCRLPGVLGAIDGTHVYIRSPGRDQALYFINRKNSILQYSQICRFNCRHLLCYADFLLIVIVIFIDIIIDIITEIVH